MIHWIDRHGKIFSRHGPHDHSYILDDMEEETGMQLQGHAEAFLEGLLRVVDDGCQLVGQWAGKLNADQRAAFLSLHDVQYVIVGGANEGYDFEDESPKEIEPSATRQINQALRQVFDKEVHFEIY